MAHLIHRNVNCMNTTVFLAYFDCNMAKIFKPSFSKKHKIRNFLISQLLYVGISCILGFGIITPHYIDYDLPYPCPWFTPALGGKVWYEVTGYRHFPSPYCNISSRQLGISTIDVLEPIKFYASICEARIVVSDCKCKVLTRPTGDRFSRFLQIFTDCYWGLAWEKIHLLWQLTVWWMY